jgi:putative (di)nucleoside polyphosphate hydrolase
MEDPMGYRSGVGIVLVNAENRVFAGHRRDAREPPWQMPQGGIEPGETLEQAAHRELQEELGTAKAVMVQVHPLWLSYDYPNATSTSRAQHYRGQRHKWFLFRFAGQDHDITLASAHPEFSSWQWMSPAELIARVVPFKRDVYRAALSHFFQPLRVPSPPWTPALDIPLPSLADQRPSMGLGGVTRNQTA